MAKAAATATKNPSREDFAAMLEESFTKNDLQEGAVVKGKVVGIEKDIAVIDIGLKTEGRVPLREFAGHGRTADIKVGDEVEVFLDRVENAHVEFDIENDAEQSIAAEREGEEAYALPESWRKARKKWISEPSRRPD